MPVFDGVKYRLVPEINNGCYGCRFNTASFGDNKCPQDALDIVCTKYNTICIENNSKGNAEYIAARAKMRLGVEVDND